MPSFNPFKLAFLALIETDITQKIAKTKILYQYSQDSRLNYQDNHPVYSLKTAGIPAKPQLVRFQEVPKRSNNNQGLINTIHAIAHIEFNAINIALDAVYRFQNMPIDYYQDWLKIAYEESTHFLLLENYLKSINYKYGDMSAHNGLWLMCHQTEDDVLTRMALVPRVLEARGLDVTPSIAKKFNNTIHSEMLNILDTIFNDEINHVKIGNKWFHKLCDDRGLDYIKTFDKLIKQHIGNKLHGNFNLEARAQAGFTDNELNYLGTLHK